MRHLTKENYGKFLKRSGENLDFKIWTEKRVDFYSTGKKGGALLSALHSNMQHGDPFVKSLVRHTLNLVSFKCLGLIFVLIQMG